ncbi:phosphonate C-P lyase system protein PhnG [Sediminicoccus sp. KRV36]|uniref:phosphonate C-P lyase system protein PhnG n=1 Tax=Sediminicoccus sp. KRV36 TaxID=3133721 RepID=UPI00200F2F7F|nr:phosphonate C-P lyase system protein PhnG [Sediminicoccus rosea]UPY39209.1 phosphonate C-P lyase system protein PhnG [Sediminicoccus rosea]
MIIAETLDRPAWMAVLARAEAAEIEALLATAPPLPAHRVVRGPEIGLTMLRGRAGGDGAAFNLGEATITRCTVSLEGGTLGHCWRLGRDRRAAELAALLDACLQQPEWRARLLATVIAPLRERQQAQAELTARRAAATEVRFATLATMR